MGVDSSDKPDMTGQMGNVRLPKAGHKAGHSGAPLYFLVKGALVPAVRKGAPGCAVKAVSVHNNEDLER